MLRTESAHRIVELQSSLNKITKINDKRLTQWPPRENDKHRTISAQLQICQKEIQLLNQLVIESKL